MDRFSVKKLLNVSLNSLVFNMERRFSFQLHETLRIDHVYPNNRQKRLISSLIYLFQDSINTTQLIGKLNEKSMKSLVESSIQSLDARHNITVETIVEINNETNPLIRDLILSLLKRQIGISILLSHSVSLTSKSHFCETGCIKRVDIKTICEDAINQTTNMVEHHYNDLFLPVITIVGEDIDKIVCIPSIVRFVLIEILKNAAVSTLEHFCITRRIDPSLLTLSPNAREFDDLRNNSSSFNAIFVKLKENESYVTIDVEDRGVGMNTFELQSSTRFLQLSKQPTSLLVDSQVSYQPHSSPIRGLGVGLSLSQLFSRHFGGDVILFSRGRGLGATVSLSIPKDLQILEAFV